MNLTCIASRLLQPISSLSEIVCMLAKPLLWKDRGPHSLDLIHPRPPEAMLTRQKASEHPLRISMYTDVNISRKLSKYLNVNSTSPCTFTPFFPRSFGNGFAVFKIYTEVAPDFTFRLSPIQISVYKIRLRLICTQWEEIPIIRARALTASQS